MLERLLPEGVTLDPVLPVAAVALGLALALAAALAAATRAAREAGRAGGVGLVAVEALVRCGLLLTLAALLLNPQRMNADAGADAGGRPEVRLIVDRSGSMSTADAPGGLTRAAFAQERWVEALVEDGPVRSRNANVEVVGFDASPRPAGEPDPPTDGDTSLLAALDAVLAASPGGNNATPPTVVLISDGRETVAPDPLGAVLHRDLRDRLRVAQGRGLAVHTVTVGEAAEPPLDLVAGLFPSTPFWIAGEPAAAELTVTATRPAPAGTASAVRVSGSVNGGPEVTLYEADLRVDATLLHTLPVPVPVEALQRMGALTPGDAGKPERAGGVTGVDLVAELLPIEGEATDANNRVKLRVPLSPTRLRVLVLEGQPYWDTKFIAQALRTDAAVSVDQVTRVTADRWERITTGPPGPALPSGPVAEAVQRLDFASFNVVMLGRNLGEVLDPAQWAALGRWVENGGHLVLTRGRPEALSSPAAARLDPMGPGVATRTGPIAALVEGPAGSGGVLGSASAAAVRADPPGLRWLERGLPVKPATRVLLRAAGTAEDAPALVAMSLGRGSVLAVLGEGLWRWALPSGNGPSRPGAEETRARFDAFWAGITRGLLFGSADAGGGLATDPLRLTLPAEVPAPGEAVRIGVRLREGIDPADAAVEVEAPSGRVVRLRPEAAVPAGGGDRADDDELTVSFVPEEAGAHAVRGLVDPAAGADAEPVVRLLVVRPLGLERTLTSADAGAMREIAARTGGEVLSPTEPAKLTGYLRDVAVSRARPPRPEPVWNTNALLLTLLGAWSGLWVLRKAAGLP